MMPLFSTGFELILFVSVVLLWILVEITGIGIIPKLRDGGGVKKSKNYDKGSNLLLRVSLYVSICIAFLLALNKIAMLPYRFFYIGILVMIIGIVVRQWAILILGRFFTLTISVQKSQKVVDYGPYRFVRHPSYLGISLTAIGIGIALGSWGGILVILLIYGLAIGYRIHIEEKYLVAELGDDYIQYMKKTKRLIPFVI